MAIGRDMETRQAEDVQLIRAHDQKAQGPRLSFQQLSLIHYSTQALQYWHSFITWQGTKHINTEITHKPAREKWGQIIQRSRLVVLLPRVTLKSYLEKTTLDKTWMIFFFLVIGEAGFYYVALATWNSQRSVCHTQLGITALEHCLPDTIPRTLLNSLCSFTYSFSLVIHYVMSAMAFFI